MGAIQGSPSKEEIEYILGVDWRGGDQVWQEMEWRERERMWGEIAGIGGKAFVVLKTVQRKLCTTSLMNMLVFDISFEPFLIVLTSA